MADGNFTDIERRVAADREALAQTLDVLGDTLAPERLKQQATQTAQSCGSDISRQLWGATRENPAAFALVGAGLAMLLSGAGQNAADDSHASTATPAKAPPRPSAQSLRGALNRGLEKLSPAARQRVLDSRLAAIQAQEALEKREEKQRRSTTGIARKRPIAASAAAFGVGALIAALLPRTEREDALMGAKRDSLMKEAENALHREMAAMQGATAQPCETATPPPTAAAAASGEKATW